MGKDTPSDIQKRNLRGFVQLMLSQTVFKAVGIKGDALKSESEMPQQASALRFLLWLVTLVWEVVTSSC